MNTAESSSDSASSDSSTESPPRKTRSLSEIYTGRQAMWLRKLLKDLCSEQSGATKLWCDNKSSIAMTKNPAFHARTKHIEIQHHFIRKLVLEEKVELSFCGTNYQHADMFTKALCQAKHKFFMEKIGMKEFESRGGDLAAEVDAATFHRGGGKSDISIDAVKNGYAIMECLLCIVTTPDVKLLMQIHHPTISFDENKIMSHWCSV
ncbi:hypothetical protein BVRB_9g216310 [Beta vulgaris subsp. vulgaris]|nr:hypothetical protein BVRB_9g216310 [Beta vulgaris subsp. vulgaris]